MFCKIYGSEVYTRVEKYSTFHAMTFAFFFSYFYSNPNPYLTATGYLNSE